MGESPRYIGNFEGDFINNIICIYNFFGSCEIMSLGVYFWGGYEKSSVVFASFSTSSKEKVNLCLEFHFVVKTKLVDNCVSFLLVIF